MHRDFPSRDCLQNHFWQQYLPQGFLSISCTASFTPSPAPINSVAIPGGYREEIAPSNDLNITPSRESLRVLVIGSRKGVTSTIHTLHRLGFAEVGEWSPLLPAPTPGEVMSILTRYILAEGRGE